MPIFHQRLDFSISPVHKYWHVKALIKLSRASGRYPECLVLKDVEMDENPVTSGGFGDIYKGRLKGQRIAVKVLKILRDRDITRLLKVNIYP